MNALHSSEVAAKANATLPAPDQTVSGDPASEPFARMARTFLASGESVRFQGRGGSMRPFIREGDWLTVSPAVPSAVRRGDVLLHEREVGGLVAHRVLTIRRSEGGYCFWTRGDASGGAKDQVVESRVLGRLIRLERESGVYTVGGWWWRMRGLVWARVRGLRGWCRRRMQAFQ